MLLAILTMPVSYRAGTDEAHPHTIYQGIVDAVFGPHHHPEPSAPAAGAASPFVAAGVPLGTAAVDGDPVAAGGPDVPQRLGLSNPIDARAPILALGALIAILLAGRVTRLDQSSLAIPRGAVPSLEPPPPRVLA